MITIILIQIVTIIIMAIKTVNFALPCRQEHQSEGHGWGARGPAPCGGLCQISATPLEVRLTVAACSRLVPPLQKKIR